MLTAIALGPAFVLAMQVGPNPNTGALPGTPEELLDRPPRDEAGEPLTPESAWLAECLDLLPAEAARAHTLAQMRRNATSGAERVLANHCLGLAATELGRWDEAKTAFLAARDEVPADEPRARSRFGTMAGNAALANGENTEALVILEQAEAHAKASASAPLEAIAATDLARALVTVGHEGQALERLERATTLEPDNPESWLLKATLLRRLDRLDDAQEAIEQAATLSAQDPRIGLEAGVIAVLSGREDAARASWDSVIALDPESDAAASARSYIGQLDNLPEPS
ncbi:MAG: tetratricopeptide repeat protein [Erythrobacter sp.]